MAAVRASRNCGFLLWIGLLFVGLLGVLPGALAQEPAWTYKGEIFGELKRDRPVGSLDGKDYKKASDISGIACAQDSGFPRLCMIVDDEAQGAQIIMLDEHGGRAGSFIPLVSDVFRRPDGRNKAIDFDGEAVAYAGGAFDWLTPFSLFCGLALIVAYALLGCTWLMMRTAGELQRRMHDIGIPLVWAVLAVTGIVSLWTPLTHPDIAERWFSMPNLLYFMPVPVLVLLCAFGLLRSIQRYANYTPFLLTLALIFLGYSGLGISLWPNIIPPSVTIWEAAAPPQSQGFTLVGALLILPLILMYTAWSYYVFRGKVSAEDGYH